MTAAAIDWQGKRVLVTGASGFIGSHLTRRLCLLGAKVDAVARTLPRSSGDMRWHAVHLEDADAVVRLLDQTAPQVVFHLAGQVSGSRDLGMVLPTVQGNLASTVNLLIAVAKHGCERFVLTGSLEEPEGNAALVVPASPYAASKWAATAYARMFHGLYGTPVSVARLFMVYGPGQRDHAKLVPYVILALLRGQVPKLTSGSRLVDWVFIDDVVDAYLAIAASPMATGHTVDVGSGRLVSVREIVDTIGAEVGAGPEPDFGGVPDRVFERERVADVVTTRELLGWQARIGLTDGLRRTIDWYRQHADGNSL